MAQLLWLLVTLTDNPSSVTSNSQPFVTLASRDLMPSWELHSCDMWIKIFKKSLKSDGPYMKQN